MTNVPAASFYCSNKKLTLHRDNTAWFTMIRAQPSYLFGWDW